MFVKYLLHFEVVFHASSIKKQRFCYSFRDRFNICGPYLKPPVVLHINKLSNFVVPFCSDSFRVSIFSAAYKILAAIPNFPFV
jgi:hypothetical protein